MNLHILTDADTESSLSDSGSISSVTHQVPSAVSVISSFDFPSPTTPATPSAIVTSASDVTLNPYPHGDLHDLSSLSSFGSLQNLARVPSADNVADNMNLHTSGHSHVAVNPFDDLAHPSMSFAQAATSMNPFIHASQPSITDPNTHLNAPPSDPFNPESTASSPSMIPSLSLSHPIPRADIEDGVVLLSPPSSDTYSLYSAPTSRAMSPAVSEAFSSFSGISGTSGVPLSVPVSASASVESLSGSEFSDFSVLETASAGERSASGSSFGLSPQSSPRPGSQRTMEDLSSSSRFRSFSDSGNGVERGGTITGRYLSREEIQQLIDSHSTRPGDRA
ncbi:hypothetical protein EV361DRAFT_95832 [Lentinula raphanica]|uniref:Uncharacterized protein n=1 Tax=Lentinula raphanica TaxID=153919 RepID=A0AA38P6B2_9AGAR|nr:hypothetical protein F5880DRAFT_257923 [Lentinula raphanica]KAJ3836981.1 hypothetical protein F5878DRAFT_236712 [Lentinula raphanica]KAJ3977225.1 hypothetical protein EV361DRAFT_95832 [Lentinula raphanica]